MVARIEMLTTATSADSALRGNMDERSSKATLVQAVPNAQKHTKAPVIGCGKSIP